MEKGIIYEPLLMNCGSGSAEKPISISLINKSPFEVI